MDRRESGETEFVLGSEAGDGVLCVVGLAPVHARVSIMEGRMEVEDLGGGVVVDGKAVQGRVGLGYPACVELGSVTLVIERWESTGSQGLETTVLQVLPQDPEQTVIQADLLPRFQEVVGGSCTAETTSRYTLVHEIGRGGMGQIYLGEDLQLKREVAVKVSSVAQGGTDLRFAHEAEVLARLAHPNIVPVYTMGTDGLGRPFYSMKLIKGRTLQSVLNALRVGDAGVRKAYPRSALLNVFRKVCDAVAFAHSKGILHRDLKPENVMVGEYGEVLVMDWGLAKVLGSVDETPTDRAELGTLSGGSKMGVQGATLEGQLMGTPQYMSPEQAQGMVSELDVRSDVYALGAVLYAILTLRAPVEGRTVEEVVSRVKSGQISPLWTRCGDGPCGEGGAQDLEIPEALNSVTLKAMAMRREDRYPDVEALVTDIQAYQNGFATSAEEAGIWRRASLWVGRNRVLTGAAAVLGVVVLGFTVRVVQKGREASMALQSLRETAPTFAVRARDALGEGQFEEALRAATFAVSLEPQNGGYHALRGNVLQVLVRWPEAVEEYRKAVRLGANEGAEENLVLTEDLVQRARKEGLAKAKVALYEALPAQGRQAEAMEFGRGLGDFWREKKKDLSVLPELVKRLEQKLLPVPGTGILLSRTELTVGEWKLYLKAEGLPDWYPPSNSWTQTDEHPVVGVTWNQARDFCDWLSAKTGREWRLPTNAEWEAAVGGTEYPWGNYYPPHWDDGNYAVAADGKSDPRLVGVDGILGTAPVASFKPNALGFYDLGGNVSEFMWDGVDEKKGYIRGGRWDSVSTYCRVSSHGAYVFGDRNLTLGFRIACIERK